MFLSHSTILYCLNIDERWFTVETNIFMRKTCVLTQTLTLLILNKSNS